MGSGPVDIGIGIAALAEQHALLGDLDPQAGHAVAHLSQGQAQAGACCRAIEAVLLQCLDEDFALDLIEVEWEVLEPAVGEAVRRHAAWNPRARKTWRPGMPCSLSCRSPCHIGLDAIVNCLVQYMPDELHVKSTSRVAGVGRWRAAIAGGAGGVPGFARKFGGYRCAQSQGTSSVDLKLITPP